MAAVPEQQAREKIDQLPGSAGCAVQSVEKTNIQVARGIVREEFPKVNEFAQKIIYRTTEKKPESLIIVFRNRIMAALLLKRQPLVPTSCN